jgi:DNA-binding NarL/FixJ family response regulator
MQSVDHTAVKFVIQLREGPVFQCTGEALESMLADLLNPGAPQPAQDASARETPAGEATALSGGAQAGRGGSAARSLWRPVAGESRSPAARFGRLCRQVLGADSVAVMTHVAPVRLLAETNEAGPVRRAIDAGAASMAAIRSSLSRLCDDQPIVTSRARRTWALAVLPLSTGASSAGAHAAAEQLLGHLHRAAETWLYPLADVDVVDIAQLPPGEQQTLELLLQGHSEKQIAVALCRSQHTIHSHIKRLHKLFQVGSRAELLARLLRR